MSHNTKNGVPYHFRAKSYPENFSYLGPKKEVFLLKEQGQIIKADQLIVYQFRQVNLACCHLSNILFNIK